LLVSTCFNHFFPMFVSMAISGFLILFGSRLPRLVGPFFSLPHFVTFVLWGREDLSKQRPWNGERVYRYTPQEAGNWWLCNQWISGLRRPSLFSDKLRAWWKTWWAPWNRPEAAKPSIGVVEQLQKDLVTSKHNKWWLSAKWNDMTWWNDLNWNDMIWIDDMVWSATNWYQSAKQIMAPKRRLWIRPLWKLRRWATRRRWVQPELIVHRGNNSGNVEAYKNKKTLRSNME